LTDKFRKVKGYFKIELLRDGVVIDSDEKHNLIMDDARRTFPKYLSGITGVQPINRLVLGTQGNIAGDILAPKQAIDGFTSDRTMLFSEESGNIGTDYTVLSFTPNGVNGSVITCDDGVSTVSSNIIDTDVVYEVNIHNTAMNGNSGAMVYTEAAFYTGDQIFSMRTFKGKIKDDSVSIKITWKIMF